MFLKVYVLNVENIKQFTQMQIDYFSHYNFINPLQRQIMELVGHRARIFHDPITQKLIVCLIKRSGTPESTTKAALRVLVKRGYLRPAIKVRGGSAYVQIRFL